MTYSSSHSQSSVDPEVQLKRFQAQNELLIQAYHKIHKTLDELRMTEDKLIASEKLASLGQRLAGVGHEINSPLGAINTAQLIIRNKNKYLHHDAIRLGSILSEEENECLSYIITSILENKRSYRAINQTEKISEYKKYFELAGIKTDDDSKIISMLASLNLDLDLSKIESILRHKEAHYILNYCRQFQILETSCFIIEESTDKASKIIKSLKNYSYDNKGEKEELDLNKSLEDVLTIYKNKFKKIDINRFYTENSTILADPDKITQVWVNLLNNAADASGHKGKINIGTCIREDHVSVYIEDFAGGMSEEVQSRLFEPFFTTKPKGQGTGLGLSIVKRIVEEENGTLEFEVTENIGTKAIVKFKK